MLLSRALLRQLVLGQRPRSHNGSVLTGSNAFANPFLIIPKGDFVNRRLCSEESLRKVEMSRAH